MMRPFRVSCNCGGVMTTFTVFYTFDQRLLLYSLCPDCMQTVYYETTTELLIQRCSALAPQALLPITPQISVTVTEVDDQFLKDMKIEPLKNEDL